MGGDDGGDENKTNTDRYAALGAKWAGGPFEVGALVDWTNKSNAVLKIGTTTLGSNDYTIEDAYTFNLAGSYDCGFAKTFLAVQYFKDASDAAGILGTTMDLVEISGFTDDDYDAVQRVFSFDGFGVHLSTQFDALGGTWKAGIGYMDGEANVNSTYAAVPSFEPSPTSRPTRLPSATNTPSRSAPRSTRAWATSSARLSSLKPTRRPPSTKARPTTSWPVSSTASNQPLRGSGRMS